MAYTPKPKDFVPDPDFPKDHPFYGRARCQAWQPNKGRQCLGLAVVSKGLDKCRRCGGSSLRGIEHPNFKTGKYSKVVPKGLGEFYNLIKVDPDIISMGERIKLLEARIFQIMNKMDEGGSFEVFKQLKSEMTGLKTTNNRIRRLAQDDPKRTELQSKAGEHLTQIDNLISRGLGDWAMWKEVQSVLELIRKMSDTEQRRIKNAETTLSAEAAWIDYYNLMLAVRLNVPDRKMRQAIQNDFSRLTRKITPGD